MEYIPYMAWIVILHKEFSAWFAVQESELQNEILANLRVLQEFGPALGRPRVDTLEESAFTQMKELRVQFRGEPFRILFAFDPKRQAIVLLGGSKQGDKRWYKKNIPLADQRYREHLEELRKKAKKEKEGKS
jgi:hypothetical protein